MKKNLDHVKIKLSNARNIDDDESLKRLIQKTILKVPKNGRRLNKLRNKKPLDQARVEKLLKLSEKDGYYSLQAFSYVYRDEIKISYLTLYRRLLKNRDVLNTLISRKVLDIYQFDVKKSDVIVKTRFKIYNNKKDYLIKFILDNFLTDSQK